MLGTAVEPIAFHIQNNRMLGDSKAGGPEDAKWSYGAICGPYRVLEDLMAGGEEDAECSFWAGRGSC